MEMEKSHYIVRSKLEYQDMVRAQSVQAATSDTSSDFEPAPGLMLVSITQGGFGQDIVDDERQLKERFLEQLFTSTGMDLPRSVEAFDQYFVLEEIDEVIDLDEDF